MTAKVSLENFVRNIRADIRKNIKLNLILTIPELLIIELLNLPPSLLISFSQNTANLLLSELVVEISMLKKQFLVRPGVF